MREDLTDAENFARLERAVRRLPRLQRDVFLAIRLEDLGYPARRRAGHRASGTRGSNPGRVRVKGGRKTERLRQERETFNVQKKQSERWFAVRMATALVLLLISVGVFAIAAGILLSPANYPPALVQSSAVALMLDLTAVAGTAITALIKSSAQPTLGPVTSRLRND